LASMEPQRFIEIRLKSGHCEASSSCPPGTISKSASELPVKI